MEKSRILVVGGTGYLGKRVVKASLREGHPTYVLHRPEIGLDIEKVQMLLSFKEQGAHLVEGSFSDHRSLVEAVKMVDVVICTISGVQMRSYHILLQLHLVDAIKEAGNIMRFIPSEFGMDPARMAQHGMLPGKITSDDKMAVRKAIEDAGIPFTYVSANCFAGYFVGGLCQPGRILPSKDTVLLHGDGNVKAIHVDEDDIATYTIKAVNDPRTLNKTLYLRPLENILSQREMVEMWEKLIGKELHKTCVSADDFIGALKGTANARLEIVGLIKLLTAKMNEMGYVDWDFAGQEYAGQVGLAHYYDVFYKGCLANFEIGEDGEEASELYPEISYVRVKDYLKRYL